MATDLPVSEALVTSLLELVQALDRLHVRYAVIGGIATSYRSHPRYTEDLDLLLEIPQLSLPGLLDDLQARGFHFDPTTTIREWTREHLTVLSFHGIRIDWLKPVIPLYQHILDAARAESWLGSSIRIASPEGLILTKLIAFRGQDQVDIENLLAANRGQLDLDLISREWQTVAELDDSRTQWLNEKVAQLYQSPESPGTPGT
jgi:hypothetical protein